MSVELSLEDRYWNGHEADCLRRGGVNRYAKQHACSCGFAALLDERDAAIRRASDLTAFAEWCVSLETDWSTSLDDVARNARAALRSQESQKPPETGRGWAFDEGDSEPPETEDRT